MTDYEALIRQLVRDGNESPKVDFKRSMNLRDKRDVAELAKLCLAVANTDSTELEGIGYVVLGAAPGELVGGADDLGSDSFRAVLVASLNRYIEPEARLEIRAFRDAEKGWFGAILIWPSPIGARPHIIAREFTVDRFSIRRGECYVRRGEATELAHRADYDRLFEERHRDRSRGQETAIFALQTQVVEMKESQDRFYQQTMALLTGTVNEAKAANHVVNDSDRLGPHKAALVDLVENGPGYEGLGLFGLVASFGANLRKNFAAAQARSRQSEAKANLKALHTCIKAYYQEHDRFPSTLAEAAFLPAPGAQYIYFLTPDDTKGGDRNSDPAFPAKAYEALARLGVRPYVSTDTYLAAAVADLDGKLDVWTVDASGELNDVTHNFSSRAEDGR